MVTVASIEQSLTVMPNKQRHHHTVDVICGHPVHPAMHTQHFMFSSPLLH